MSKYSMTYLSGGGTEYGGGLWEVKSTEKSVTFELLEKPFFESNMPRKVRISRTTERKHCLRDWGDGDYTVYPFQSGTPHIFTPIKGKEPTHE